MHWNIKDPPLQKTVAHLIDCLGVDPVIAQLLAQRGFSTFEEAKSFFRPHIGQLHDPFLMKDMDKAVARLQHAINQKENIMVYGDYDVDGTTSVSLLTHFLRSQDLEVTPYIPDRYAEGYGLSTKGIDAVKAANIKFMIALDCGIKAVKQVEYAKKLGIELIICDHHTPGDVLPDALAVLDPKRSDCTYPFKELCGCGVGFKLIQGLLQHQGKEVNEIIAYLDFVAVAIAADIVPIVGENRVLAFLGLQQLNNHPRPGLKAIMRDKPTKQIISDILFGIAPRINAAGRMKHGLDAVKLLLSESGEEAKKIAQEVEIYNTSRRKLEKEITEEALTQILENEEENNATNVVYSPHWHKGVIGIVASRIIETYYRPTLVFTMSSQGILAASARSVPGFDLYEAIDACRSHIIQFGGHKYAAGLTIKEENYKAFKENFEAQVAQTITAVQKEQALEIDLALPFTSITLKLLRVLKQMEPFGPENRSPIFYTEGVRDSGYAKLVGQDKSHLKARFIQGSSSPIDAIGFSLGEKIYLLKKRSPLRIAYSIEENVWHGHVGVQLRLKDVE
ncbi:MAG: single-stranded-DNA-specific exonuclease RecJ [Flavobacteriaceae bacterium]|uniref:Single-stranded-DNA-specific exonuclease RecJ n=1 Tax=uncultured Flavobacteriia bacterium TaxID=212695 RepID=H6RFF3_9BACT|nr:recombination protein RecJ [uncultured bacterium]MAS68693.1 single-stranded-DNA-specific exonuclease RecJ [Flavobacteriaceae bacterium]CCF99764.1 single-stranded-DNA-specific exonuclease RecJ [uncultured Flavobacteriia bacterium]|tara:strand:- start:2116 stop:3804 length:1689 start_codon:yes stop_codon:yes gene_type:complete